MCCTTRCCCDGGVVVAVATGTARVAVTQRAKSEEGLCGGLGGTARVAVTQRAKSEERLGWRLAAPALVVMLAVTAYPMLNAVWLSLFSYRLTDPNGREFVGLSNYGVVLSDGLWWQDVLTTVGIAVVTVAIELVIGMAFALVMHRITFGRSVIRTSILIPYGIITVVSAFAWKYAFALDSGFVNSWFGLGDYAWFSHRFASLFVI